MGKNSLRIVIIIRVLRWIIKLTIIKKILAKSKGIKEHLKSHKTISRINQMKLIRIFKRQGNYWVSKIKSLLRRVEDNFNNNFLSDLKPKMKQIF